MQQQTKEYIIEKINQVINSKLSTLDNTDIERLVVTREQLKASKNDKDNNDKGLIRKALSEILKLFTDS